MDKFLLIFCAVVGAYLIGSINVSVLVSKLAYKSDVRQHGSGNAGATNMARVFGLVGGISVLIGDFGKGMLAMFLAKIIGTSLLGELWGEYAMISAGAACMIGHAFPIFFSFKGGKGITVGAAISVMMDWRTFLIILSVFVIVFIISKIVSLSSVCAASALLVASLLFYFCGVDGFSLAKLCLGIFAPLFAIYLHRQNIARLIKREEKKFTYKKKQNG